MKYIISERQYKLLNEQSSPIKIGCNDYDSIPKYCGQLKMTKEHGDMIISQYRQLAKTDLINHLNNFIASAKEKAGGEYKTITNKFVESGEIAKNEIIKYLDDKYPSAVYAAIGIQNRLDTNIIMTDLVKILYDSFYDVWNKSYIMRNAAGFFVTKKNIKNIKDESKDMWDRWLDNFISIIDFYFVFNVDLRLRDFAYNLNQKAPLCKQVIITADTGCNKLPSNKWYNPKMQYKWGYSLTSEPFSNETVNNINNIYWTKISSLLDDLV